jgi:hypothetical protein
MQTKCTKIRANSSKEKAELWLFTRSLTSELRSPGGPPGAGVVIVIEICGLELERVKMLLDLRAGL